MGGEIAGGRASLVSPAGGPAHNPGYQRMFAPGKLTLGLFFAIESYSGPIPTMSGQIALAQRAEELGFAALWARDVPLFDPTFGDVGQIFDPWPFLGYVAASTDTIALVTGAIVLPLRHPLHTAKAAASIDHLSNGRLVLGVSSGDRPVEYPAFGRRREDRAALFRDALAVIDRSLHERFPAIISTFGELSDADLIPKPTAAHLPLLVTGHSGQTVQWIRENSQGWIMYPRPVPAQQKIIAEWNQAAVLIGDAAFKPFSQSLYIDLAENPSARPCPIHLGYRLGATALVEHLANLREIGVNHVVVNLKYGQRPARDVLEELGSAVLPLFPSHSTSD